MKRNLIIAIIALVIVMALPSFAQNQSPDVSLVFYVEEITPNGTLIGSISGDDPNGDALTYTITSGNSSNAFALGLNSGDLTVNDENELIFTATPVYQLQVDVDDGFGGVSVAMVTINVTEKPLGLEDMDDIIFYPNVARNHFYIESSEWNLSKAEVQMSSLDGKIQSLDLSISQGLIQAPRCRNPRRRARCSRASTRARRAWSRQPCPRGNRRSGYRRRRRSRGWRPHRP